MDNVNIMVSPKSDRAYHHGDLRNALIEAGLSALEAQDASELSLRALAQTDLAAACGCAALCIERARSYADFAPPGGA